MKIELHYADPGDEHDWGLWLRLLGETELESIFLSHLQAGHTIELNDLDSYGHGELQIVLHNAAPKEIKKARIGRGRNQK